MEKLVEEGRRTHGAQEQHAGDDNNYVRSLVLGGLDGIVTTFAVVSAATGGNLSDRVLLLMGFANLVADGMSMGLGDFLSSKAEKDYTVKELDREIWEFENYPKGEIEEMVELYVRRGLEEGDARTIVTTMAKVRETGVFCFFGSLLACHKAAQFFSLTNARNERTSRPSTKTASWT